MVTGIQFQILAAIGCIQTEGGARHYRVYGRVHCIVRRVSANLNLNPVDV